MSAFGGKADIIQGKADFKKCPLMTDGVDKVGYRRFATLYLGFGRGSVLFDWPLPFEGFATGPIDLLLRQLTFT